MAQTNDGLASLKVVAVGSDKEGTEELDCLVSIVPPSKGSRTPSHIVAVIDVSGSMSDQATLAGDKSGESKNFSLLDITKHAVKTIINALGDQDLFSLVSFTTNAKIECEQIKMDAAGKKKAQTILDGLHPQASTNLWDGLNSGLQVVKKANAADSSRLASILLLTDGVPNMIPPRGHLPMLKKFKDSNNGTYGCSINTFGFGYSLDSPLLRELAIEGGGTYAFIPDSGFVGTIFVNAVAMILSTLTPSVTLSLEEMNGAKIIEVYGGHPCVTTSWGRQVSVGGVQFGQTKNLVCRLKVPNSNTEFIAATMEYTPRLLKESVKVTEECKGLSDNSEVAVQKIRLNFVDEVREAMKLFETDENAARQKIIALTDTVMKSEAAADKRVQELLKDISGQVTEALSKKEFFQKWGRHYLPSLWRAHLLEQCNNFKDPGVQVYGGQLFEKTRDELDEMFLKLPPPKPTRNQRNYNSYSNSSYSSVRSASATANKSASRSVNMSMYYNSSGVCFHGNNSVKTPSGSKFVKDLRQGDIVKTPSGTAKVRCVVQTRMDEDKKCDLVKLPGSGLLLTPWHPIRVKGTWRYPCEFAPIYSYECEAVYSFLLESDHVLLINGVECSGLAHGFTENKVITHAYFGTQAIIEDLKKLRGWTQGFIAFEPDCVVRGSDGLLCGLNAKKEIVA